MRRSLEDISNEDQENFIEGIALKRVEQSTGQTTEQSMEQSAGPSAE